jgi:glutamine cyclotransferase
MTWDLNGAAIVGGTTFTGPGANFTYLGSAVAGGNGCASIVFRDPTTGLIVADNMFNSVVSTVTTGLPGGGYAPVAVI